MRGLQLSFKVLTFVGCRRPESWSARWYTRAIYNTGTIFMFVLLYPELTSQFLDIAFNVQNADDFTENVFGTQASMVSSCKLLSMVVNRKNIDMLTNMLAEKPYKPLDTDEMRIQHKFDKLVHANSLRFLILVETTCASVGLWSLYTGFGKGSLTYRTWLPYDYNSSTSVFCLTFAYQLVSLTAGSLVNVGCDSIISGLLMYICCQMEILEYRLGRVSGDRNSFRDCVRHHNGILKYALKVNSAFKMTIAVQFAVSMLALCSNLYKMTRTPASNAVPLLLYIASFLVQILIYCWYGNEVKLKSLQLLDNIFATDWVTLNESVKKGLLIMMKRAMIPIEFTTAYVLCMNLNSFVALLKMSYSFYNILKQT